MKNRNPKMPTPRNIPNMPTRKAALCRRNPKNNHENQSTDQDYR